MWTEVRELDAIEVQELSEKERSRERKPAIKKRQEKDELAAARLGRFLITGNPPPILLGIRDHSLGYVWKKQGSGHLRAGPGAFACHRFGVFGGLDLRDWMELGKVAMAADYGEDEEMRRKQ